MGSKQGHRPFDPRPHLRRLENGAEYLDLKWRLAWMRSEYPDAQIETELMKDDEDGALFKALVRLPDGGSAMAHASVPRSSGAHIEQAESKAVGRALAALGYGAEYTEDDSFPTPPTPGPATTPTPTPTPTPPTPLRPARERAADIDTERPTPRVAEAEPPRASEPPRRIDSPRPLQRHAEPEAPEREREPDAPAGAEAAPPAAARPASAPATAPAAAAGEGEDVSWNKFWMWAKRRGYRDANHLRELLGDDVMQHTPQEVRNMLRKHELENPPPGMTEE